MPKQGGNQTARICCDGLRLAHSENFIIFAFVFAGHQIFWRFFSTPLTIEVKNVFNVFFISELRFLLFLTFFLFSKRFLFLKTLAKFRAASRLTGI